MILCLHVLHLSAYVSLINGSGQDFSGHSVYTHTVSGQKYLRIFDFRQKYREVLDEWTPRTGRSLHFWVTLLGEIGTLFSYIKENGHRDVGWRQKCLLFIVLKIRGYERHI